MQKSLHELIQMKVEILRMVWDERWWFLCTIVCAVAYAILWLLEFSQVHIAGTGTLLLILGARSLWTGLSVIMALVALFRAIPNR